MRVSRFVKVPRELLNMIEQELRQGSYEQQEVLDLLSKHEDQDKIMQVLLLLEHISGDYNGETARQIAKACDNLSEFV